MTEDVFNILTEKHRIPVPILPGKNLCFLFQLEGLILSFVSHNHFVTEKNNFIYIYVLLGGYLLPLVFCLL